MNYSWSMLVRSPRILWAQFKANMLCLWLQLRYLSPAKVYTHRESLHFKYLSWLPICVKYTVIGVSIQDRLVVTHQAKGVDAQALHNLFLQARVKYRRL